MLHSKNNFIITKLKQFIKEPWFLKRRLLGIIRGFFYRLLYFNKIKGGWGMVVYGKLKIIGPGKIYLSKYNLFVSDINGPVVFFTYKPETKIIIGAYVTFNSTKIVSEQKIIIKEYSCIGYSFITDTAAHLLSADRRINKSDKPISKPVIIEKNVWISINVTVLHGSHIGENSVIGAASLVRGEVPSNVFASGNPLRVIKKIPQKYEEAKKKD